jgi:DNA-binding PadR family transcriptional regulator
MILQELELGAIQAHILFHAAQAPIYGVWMAEELARHGYTISYGTLYPTLRRMMDEGLLLREERRAGSQVRKYYVATEAGQQTLAQVQHLIRELYQEVVAEASASPACAERHEGGG